MKAIVIEFHTWVGLDFRRSPDCAALSLGWLTIFFSRHSIMLRMAEVIELCRKKNA
jgi:hypothetical protein